MRRNTTWNIGWAQTHSISTLAPKVSGSLSRLAFADTTGGKVTLKVGDAPFSTRYVRVLMTESSNTCDEHGSDDVRNCVGYAIQRIEVGRVDAGGRFVEAPKGPSEKRAAYCVSSIDPWHSADDATVSRS